MDALTAIKYIRANSELAKIAVIALTGCVMVSDRERCLEVGANEYLTRPVKLKNLTSVIQQFL